MNTFKNSLRLKLTASIAAILLIGLSIIPFSLFALRDRTIEQIVVSSQKEYQAIFGNFLSEYTNNFVNWSRNWIDSLDFNENYLESKEINQDFLGFANSTSTNFGLVSIKIYNREQNKYQYFVEEKFKEKYGKIDLSDIVSKTFEDEAVETKLDKIDGKDLYVISFPIDDDGFIDYSFFFVFDIELLFKRIYQKTGLEYSFIQNEIIKNKEVSINEIVTELPKTSIPNKTLSLIVKRDLQDINQLFNSLSTIISVALALIFVLTIFLVHFLLKDNLRPLNNIILSIGKYLAGSRDERIEVERKDEIGVVSNEVNHFFEIMKIHEENLNKEKEAAQLAEKSKTEFLANMSHEIRTPLNGIIGMSSLLLESEQNDEKKADLELVKKSGDFLLSIINDILDLSKINSGKLELENLPVSVNDLLNSVKNIVEPLSMEKKLYLKFDNQLDGVFIEGDSTRLLQILINLCSNAIKFTEDGGLKIEVSTNDQKLYFKVTDTGIGIPKDKTKTVFEDFTQASSDTTRKYGGTGLGLSIVANLVNMMRGRVICESELGKGTTFIVEIPFVEADKRDLVEDIDEDLKISTHSRILIFEDNKINQKLIIKILKSMGIENVTIADNGVVGEKAYLEGEFDLIFMDCMMPERDGYETTKILREKHNCQLKIIAITANAFSEEINRCKESGMDDFLSKPYTKQDLIKVMNRNS